MENRPPLPPFNAETATQKARMAEDAWNSCQPERIALAYTFTANGVIAVKFFRDAQKLSNS